MRTDIYQSPLCERYASKEMQSIFSNDRKFSTWRKLWVALAESEKELGLHISDEQIEEMKAQIDNIDYEKARQYESELRHDVMAHVHTFGDACPKAAGIIHLGATSCYVGDNTDIILMQSALLQIRNLLLNAVEALSEFAMEYKDIPTLAYTHFQAAQPTTVGKRACLWMNDLLFDIEQLDFQLGKEKEFVAMPSYMVKQNGGKSQYQDVCFPVTKEFREKLYDALMDCYQQERDKAMNQGMEQATSQSMERAESRQPDRNLPFR